LLPASHLTRGLSCIMPGQPDSGTALLVHAPAQCDYRQLSPSLLRPSCCLQARQKLAGVMQQKRSLELDIEELQQKYQTKSRWVHHLRHLGHSTSAAGPIDPAAGQPAQRDPLVESCIMTALLLGVC
jgi:hypothetical protein